MEVYKRIQTVNITITFLNSSKAVATPDTSLTATVYDPMQNKLVDAADILANLTVATGLYFYNYSPAATAILGSEEHPWTIDITSVNSGNTLTESVTFYLE